MDAWRSDLRFALRRLRRSPGFAVTATLVLGLGLGAAAAAFALVNGLFLRALPGVAAPNELVTLHPSAASSPTTLRFIEASVTELAGVAGYVDQLLSLDAGDRAERRLGLLVSDDYFRVLGVRPVAGRPLEPEDQRGDSRVAVVGHGFWKERLGSDSTAVGRTLSLNGEPFWIVGVAPEGFVGAVAGFRFDIWVPLAAAPFAAPSLDLSDPELDRLELVGRLADGITLERAREAVRSAAAGLAATHPGLPRELEIRVERFTGFDDDLREPARALLVVLGAIAACLLVLAMANAAGMLVARGIVRSREVAIRRALGGSRGRSVRPLFLEGLLLALAGAVVGLGVAGLAGRLFRATLAGFPVDLVLELGLDARVTGFVLLLALLVGTVIGAVPAVRAREAELRGAMGGRGEGPGGRGQASWLRRSLVVGQIAGSALLLVVAGAFLAILHEASGSGTGPRPDSLHVAPFVDLRLAGIEAEDSGPVREELLRRVTGLRGVDAAAFASSVPLDFTGMDTGLLRVDDVPPPAGMEGFEVGRTAISPGYFATLGMELLRGREFRPEDGRLSEPVAVVNHALARRFWPGEKALGRRIDLDGVRYRIVGVAPDVRTRPLEASPSPGVYVALSRHPTLRTSLLVRSPLPTGTLTGEVRRAAREVVPSLPVELQPLAAYQRIALLPQRLVAGTGGLLGGLGALLAAIGVYGVAAFFVARRRREIGIRVAVGARPLDVAGRVLREGLILAGVGLALGGLLALVAFRLLGGLVADPSSPDLPAVVAALGVVLAAVLVGTALPTLDALRVDPAVCLREE